MTSRGRLRSSDCPCMVIGLLVRDRVATEGFESSPNPPSNNGEKTGKRKMISQCALDSLLMSVFAFVQA